MMETKETKFPSLLTREDDGVDFLVFSQDPNDQTTQILTTNSNWSISGL